MSEDHLSVQKDKTGQQEKTLFKGAVIEETTTHQPLQDDLAKKQTETPLSVSKLTEDIDHKRMKELPKETEPSVPMDQGAITYIRNLLSTDKSGFAAFTSSDRELIEKCILSQGENEKPVPDPEFPGGDED